VKELSLQEESISSQEVIIKEVLPLNPFKAHQHREATMIREDKNKNGKRNTKTHITGKKARKISKKKAKLQKLQEVPEKTLQEVDLQALNLVETVEPCRMGLHPDESI
jgi:hypothetical protein